MDVVDAALEVHQLVVAHQKLELATRLGRLIAQLPQHVLQRNRGVAAIEHVAHLHDRHGPAGPAAGFVHRVAQPQRPERVVRVAVHVADCTERSLGAIDGLTQPLSLLCVAIAFGLLALCRAQRTSRNRVLRRRVMLRGAHGGEQKRQPHGSAVRWNVRRYAQCVRSAPPSAPFTPQGAVLARASSDPDVNVKMFPLWYVDLFRFVARGEFLAERPLISSVPLAWVMLRARPTAKAEVLSLEDGQEEPPVALIEVEEEPPAEQSFLWEQIASSLDEVELHEVRRVVGEVLVQSLEDVYAEVRALADILDEYSAATNDLVSRADEQRQVLGSPAGGLLQQELRHLVRHLGSISAARGAPADALLPPMDTKQRRSLDALLRADGEHSRPRTASSVGSRESVRHLRRVGHASEGRPRLAGKATAEGTLSACQELGARAHAPASTCLCLAPTHLREPRLSRGPRGHEAGPA